MARRNAAANELDISGMSFGSRVTILPGEYRFRPVRTLELKESAGEWFLEWRPGLGATAYVKPTLPTGTPLSPGSLLDRFIRLETPEDILTYARTSGLLGTCRHNPHKGLFPMPAPAHQLACQGCAYDRGRGRPRREPLSSWEYCIRLFKAALIVSAREARQMEPPKDQWEIVAGHLRAGHRNREGLWVDDRSSTITRLMSILFAENGAIPYMEPPAENGTFAFRLRAPNLLAALAVETAAALTSSSKVLECSGCHRLFTREQRINPNRRNGVYCDECGDGDRGSKRASYHRRKSAAARGRARAADTTA